MYAIYKSKSIWEVLNMRRIVLLLVMCGILGVVAADKQRLFAQEGDCAALPPTRLDDVRYGRVLPGAPNNLRAKPSTSAERVGTIAGGQFFTAGDQAAVCAEGHVWRKITTLADGLTETITAWTVETVDDAYTIEPLIETQTEYMTVHTPPSITVGTPALVPAEVYRPDGLALPPTYEMSLTIEGQTRGGTLRLFNSNTVWRYPTWTTQNEQMNSLLTTLLYYPENFDRLVQSYDNRMPYWEIGRGQTQLLWARVQAFEGGNGGVRFITQYSESDEPTAITRDSLIYHFIGGDELGMFSFSMPLTVAALPASAAEDRAFQAVGTDAAAYAAYLAQVKQTLEGLTDPVLALQLYTYDTMRSIWQKTGRTPWVSPDSVAADHPVTVLPTSGCATLLQAYNDYEIDGGAPALALRTITDAPTDFVWQVDRGEAVTPIAGPFCVADNTYWLMVNTDQQMGFVSEFRDNGGSIFAAYSGSGLYPYVDARYRYHNNTACKLYMPDSSVRVYAEPNADGTGYALLPAAILAAAGLVRNDAGDWWYLPRGVTVILAEREVELQGSVWVKTSDVYASNECITMPIMAEADFAAWLDGAR
jgi:hypothetical protein